MYNIKIFKNNYTDITPFVIFKKIYITATGIGCIIFFKDLDLFKKYILQIKNSEYLEIVLSNENVFKFYTNHKKCIFTEVEDDLRLELYNIDRVD